MSARRRAGRAAAILVEGESDRAAIEALARLIGRDLEAEGVAVVAIGGATNITRYLRRLEPRYQRLAGLCDAGEEADFKRALEGSGLGTRLSREEMEHLGFYVCEADLEDELIRALGADSVQRVIARRGEIRSFRSLQRQPAHRGSPIEDQLHRFVGTKAGRKIAYASALVEALDLDRAPRPLSGVLSHV